MKTILLTAAFCSIAFLTSNAQIIAGQHGSNDLFVNLNHQVTGSNSNTVTYSLDLDNDVITDFVFSVCYYQSPMLHYWDNQISSAGQWELANTNLVCDTSGFIEFADSLGSQDTVNSFFNWDTFAYFRFESQGAPNPAVCLHSKFDSCAYIGIRKKMPNDTLYGWFYVKSGRTNFTILSYAINMVNASIPVISSGNSFLIFPNPASDEINISCTNNSEYAYTIRDIAGRTLLGGSFNGNRCMIETRSLEKGIYFIVLSDGDKLSTRKFIKG